MSANLSEDQLEEAKEAFKLADKTSSGNISVKEVPSVMRALGLDPSDDDIASMLEGKGDTLTFQTFLNLIGRRMNEVVDNEELRVAFSVFDRDNQVNLNYSQTKYFHSSSAGLAERGRAEVHARQPG